MGLHCNLVLASNSEISFVVRYSVSDSCFFLSAGVAKRVALRNSQLLKLARLYFSDRVFNQRARSLNAMKIVG